MDSSVSLGKSDLHTMSPVQLRATAVAIEPEAGTITLNDSVERSISWTRGKVGGTIFFTILGLVGLAILALGVCSHFHVGALATWTPKLAQALHFSQKIVNIATIAIGSVLTGGAILAEALIHRKAIEEKISYE